MNSDSPRSEKISTAAALPRWWGALLSDLTGEPRFPAPGLWVWKILPLFVGILVTIVLVAGNYDLKIQQAIYRAGEGSWELGKHPFWMALYHVGPYSAIILGAASLIGLCLSWSMLRFGKWRRVYVYIVLLLFLGPAVIVNFGLKDNWGRPRPIDVDSMGGRQPFEHVFVLNESRKGKSFPCGHASTGFVFMAGFFIFFRHRRRLAYGTLIFGVVFGSLLGIARMLQGGHFLTDVIWVAIICYYLAFWLYYLVGLKDSVSRQVKKRHKMPVKIRVAIAVVVALSSIGILLATPYWDDRITELSDTWEPDARISLRVTLGEGRVELVPSDKLRVTKKSSGHGVPTSRVSAALWESEHKNGISAHYFERASGWFHELQTESKIELPWERIRTIIIDNHSADVVIDVGELSGRIPFSLGQGEGSVQIRLNGNKLALNGEANQKIEGRDMIEKDEDVEKGLILKVKDEFLGTIELVK